MTTKKKLEPKVRYPELVFELPDANMPEGNAYAILANVKRLMRRAGVEQGELEAFRVEATSGDYNHLRRVVRRWVSCV